MNDLDRYQLQASRTHNFELDRRERFTMLSMGIAGEGGELVDHIKKHVFHGHELDLLKVKQEIGDLLWYVAVLSQECGFTLAEVADLNIEKLRKRYPEGFSVEASVNRKGDE